MRIIWMPGAERDVTGLWEYVAADNSAAADRQVEHVISAVMNLVKFPGMGRIGRCPGTREVVVGKTPYIVMYRIKKRTVEVLRVLHSSQQWPEDF
jgi:toxin ParE1/3/4